MTVAPQPRNSSATVDLPEAMLPVRATFSMERRDRLRYSNAVWSSSFRGTLWQCRQRAS